MRTFSATSCIGKPGAYHRPSAAVHVDFSHRLATVGILRLEVSSGAAVQVSTEAGAAYLRRMWSNTRWTKGSAAAVIGTPLAAHKPSGGHRAGVGIASERGAICITS